MRRGARPRAVGPGARGVNRPTGTVSAAAVVDLSHMAVEIRHIRIDVAVAETLAGSDAECFDAGRKKGFAPALAGRLRVCWKREAAQAWGFPGPDRKD